MTNELADILTGSNDEHLLHELYKRIGRPCNPAQTLFVQAWELSGFIASDGFENLFEQDRSLDQFAQMLADIGFPEALPIFQKVTAVVPDAMLSTEYDTALRDHLLANFDRLKELLDEYLDVAEKRLLPAFGEYVRTHKEDFGVQMTRNQMNQNGSDAYRWIHQNTDYMLETPDDAFDWVFMLTEDDWQLLTAHWDDRTVHAKEALAYIVCEGPSRQSRDMLLRALRDKDTNVASQAAESLISQRELDGEDFPPLDPESERLVASLLEDDAT